MAARFRLKSLIPSEDSEQECLIQWAKTQRWRERKLSDLIIMIPNGAYLGVDPRQRAVTMARLKRMGFRNGVFDLLLPIPRGRAPGLWVELKRRKGGIVSDDQHAFAVDMMTLGWVVAICEGWDQAKDSINRYLQGAAP
jgi:hypothetical protein